MFADRCLPTLGRSVTWGAALAVAALAGAAQAKDIEHTCLAAPGAEETATFVFHPKLFGVDGNEGDGDLFTDDFEHKFYYEITVTDFDPAKPGWTGPTRCTLTGGWALDWDIPNLRPEFVTHNPGAIIYLKNVPRHSKVSMRLSVLEDDDGRDDYLDFDPAPGGDFDLFLSVFVNQNTAQTMVGAREGRNDVTLNSAKRVVGDGRIGYDLEHVRAFIEFVVNIHPDNWQSDPVTIGPIAPGAIPGTALGTIAGLNNEPVCRDYALNAVAMNVEAQKLACGFAPPVWSNDHQMHFDWCMKGDNAKLAPPENVKRATELQACAAKNSAQTNPGLSACAIYAVEATAMAAQAAQLGCGLTGPRWSGDYAGHFAWCMAGIDPLVLIGETAGRASELAVCKMAKGGN